MPRLTAVAVAVAALVVLLPSSSLFAQEFESLGGLRLRFDAPGARGAAMGGASEALSDSFSAATNPASLAKQQTRTAAVEFRDTNDTTDYLTGGTIGTFTSSSFDTASRGARGAVLVVPARIANVAFFYDEPVSLSRDTNSLVRSADLLSIGVRGDALVPSDECVVQGEPSPCALVAYFSAPAIYPTNASLSVRRYGAAAARSFGRLAAGASMQYVTVDEAVQSLGLNKQVSGGRLTWNAGLQLDVTSRVRVGGSYRSSARWDGERTMAVLNQVPQTFETSFTSPASYAFGIAADLTPNLTIAADAVRVKYSDMLGTPDVIPPAMNSIGFLWYEMPDVTELRAGVEYRLPTRVPVALRAGVWRDPAHRARAFSNAPHIAETINAVMLLDQDENHVTAGIGVGNRVRLDAAYDRSENTSRASLAIATTF